MTLIVLVTLWLLWVLFNLFVPYSLLYAEDVKLKSMSMGRIPADILFKANASRVKYYTGELKKRGAFTVWIGLNYVVVLDNEFLKVAQPAQIRFVLAHELGHCALGHIRKRFLCVCTGLILLPIVREWLKELEGHADAFGEELSGLPRSVLYVRDVADYFSTVDKARGVQHAPQNLGPVAGEGTKPVPAGDDRVLH